MEEFPTNKSIIAYLIVYVNTSNGYWELNAKATFSLVILPLYMFKAESNSGARLCASSIALLAKTLIYLKVALVRALVAVTGTEPGILATE